MTNLNIHVASGGTGTSAMQVIRTALAQFDSLDTPVQVVPNIREIQEIERLVAEASAAGSLIVHTLVDAQLRQNLIDTAHGQRVDEIDLIGPLLSQFQLRLGRKPHEQPGLYRKLREHDIRRIEAIEFAVAHDDGQRADDLPQADIVLTGVSRVGKTPLSMYLSTMGWKVANVPLVLGINPPERLFQLDSRQVIGLTMDPGQLVLYRQRRQRHLGATSQTPYAEPFKLVEELEYANSIFRKNRFTVIDMTDRPIEESAHEILAAVMRRTYSDSD
jgi:regulator of PEP synthase PpsR (kinase-PPPase family)